MTRQVLVVEDHKDIAELVELHLRDLGLEVQTIHDGQTAFQALTEQAYDLVVLDLMLPEMDGLELCRRLRSEMDYTPVLMLTAKGSETDRVLGLELGADDYLTKPFSLRELQARVKALLRRVDALSGEPAKIADQKEQRVIQRDDLLIDPQRHVVSLSGETVELTAREFALLHYFATHPGRVFTRAQLLDAVWGYGHVGYEHTVNSHINRLRAKIEPDPSRPRFIQTVWGVGYRFAEQR